MIRFSSFYHILQRFMFRTLTFFFYFLPDNALYDVLFLVDVVLVRLVDTTICELGNATICELYLYAFFLDYFTIMVIITSFEEFDSTKNLYQVPLSDTKVPSI